MIHRSPTVVLLRVRASRTSLEGVSPAAGKYEPTGNGCEVEVLVHRKVFAVWCHDSCHR